MNAQPTWMLYGAYGHTGQRIAEQAVAAGMRPVLAGRDAARVADLARRLGCPHRALALDDPLRLRAQLDGLAAVLHCAGPFSATAQPMIDACLQAKTAYLDLTGEIAVILAAAARHEQAVQAGVPLVPAVGFDVVPSDCLAAMLAARLPNATRLQLAFTGMSRISTGTAKTVLENFSPWSWIRAQGELTRIPLAERTVEIPFRGGRRWAIAMPWGDLASAWHSTRIPNIEVYVAMPQAQITWLRRLRRLIPLKAIVPESWLVYTLRRMLAKSGAAETGGSSFWGRVENAAGQSVQATLETPEAYHLTVLTALACLREVLKGKLGGGFFTPATAFGADFVLGIPGTDLRWEEAR